MRKKKSMKDLLFFKITTLLLNPKIIIINLLYSYLFFLKTNFYSKIGGVDVGGVFGEEEIIRKTKRKYSAKSNNSSTALYIIHREVKNSSAKKFLIHSN